MIRTTAAATILAVAGSVFCAEPTTLTVTFADTRPAVQVSGTVFEDNNGNGKFDSATDTPLAGIGVSDGRSVILTDSGGRYKLDCDTTSSVVFVTQPADFQRTNSFYRLIPYDPANTEHRVITFDFPLHRAPLPDPKSVKFVQTTDIHISGEDDRKRFASAIEEINNLAPGADFVVATGDLINAGDRINQFEVYTSTSQLCKIPWYNVFGNHDANRGGNKTKNYKSFLGPDYYSADFGDLHLVMLNSVHKSARQDAWLDRDIALLGRGKRIFAFQHYAANDEDLAKLERYNVRAIFTGHWHSNKITAHENGMVSINHPTFIMGGIDGSPSSFRIISVEGERITSEFRYNDFGKHLWITYPQGSLTGPELLLASIYDTSGGVKDARFRIGGIDAAPIAEGILKQISPLAWMTSLLPADLGIKSKLPSDFLIRVRATNNRGEQWETSQSISSTTRLKEAAAVKLGADWPEFMGNAQRTGAAPKGPILPLELRWITPTHGTIDFGSPVLFKGRIAIGAKDRDNLLNNGVAIINAVSGQSEHFIKTDSMVNHSPAFAEDPADGPGILYAVSAGGTVYRINPETGGILTKSNLGENQQRWIYSSPAIQDKLAIFGSSAFLMAVTAQFGEARWTNNSGVDWISSYASPSLAGDLVIMGSNWQEPKTSLYALDVHGGQLKWSNRCPGISGSVAVAKGRGYAIDNVDKFKVIDLATGTDVSSRSLEKGWSMSTPAIDPDIIVVPTGAGTVHAFDMSTLTEKWVFRAGPGIWKMAPYEKEGKAIFSSPTICGGLVFIGSSDGKLYALDKASGAVRWFYDFGIPTLATPCVSGNTLFTAAYDGNVYAFTSH